MENLVKHFTNFKNEYYGSDSEKEYLNLKEIFDILGNIITNNQYQSYNKIENDILYGLGYYKYMVLQLSDDFIKYLNDHGANIESSISKTIRTELKNIEICKYLQSKRTPQDIYYHFATDKDNRHPEREIKSFEDGFHIYGNLVTARNLERGSRQFAYPNYDLNNENFDMVSSVNPIGLALNTTEVFTLMVSVINELDKKSIYYPIYERVMKKMYLQLSEKSKKIIDSSIWYAVDDISLKFEAEQEWFIRKSLNQIEYAFKASAKLKISFIYNDKLFSNLIVSVSDIFPITLIDERNNNYIINDKESIISCSII